MALLPGPWGQAASLAWLGLAVPEGLWRRDGHRIQLLGRQLGAGWSLAGLTALADLLFLRLGDEPLRFPRAVAISLGGAFPEVLVAADVDISGEAIGARPEAQALGLRQMG